jgi:7-carboxy-7-deazaguanine synthase
MQCDILLINEIYQTVQGEAKFTGTPAVFLRLQGCPVGCAWCDTKHTWEIKQQNIIPINTMLSKKNDSHNYSEMSVDEVVKSIQLFDAFHVVVTGGEPCLYNLIPLTTKLIDNGYSVQIETSGTHEISVHSATWVTVSPKFNMTGRLLVREDALRRADEIKMPVGKLNDVDILEKYVIPFIDMTKVAIWLQPLSQSKKATALCIKIAIEKRFHVSIQTHKYIGIR